MTEYAGVSPEESAKLLAQPLPTGADKASPGGEMPTGSLEDLIKQQNF
ncbi:hypothetical protein OG413_39390 [Streptomyces sp. NBC_01433]|nr:hypothetical protein [Streptomyces sp. NBC_01433]MCX4681265.1 hypothetical protein [Streptomyces sp. NBC_01433]